MKRLTSLPVVIILLVLVIGLICTNVILYRKTLTDMHTLNVKYDDRETVDVAEFNRIDALVDYAASRADAELAKGCTLQLIGSQNDITAVVQLLEKEGAKCAMIGSENEDGNARCRYGFLSEETNTVTMLVSVPTEEDAVDD